MVMSLPLLRMIEPTAPFSTRVFGKLPEENKAGAKSILPSVLAASIIAARKEPAIGCAASGPSCSVVTVTAGTALSSSISRAGRRCVRFDLLLLNQSAHVRCCALRDMESPRDRFACQILPARTAYEWTGVIPYTQQGYRLLPMEDWLQRGQSCHR